jgi:hypothetical protein
VNEVQFLRIQTDETEESKKFPLGRFPYRTMINFGRRRSEDIEKADEIIKQGGVVLNHPNFIENASNKWETYLLLKEEGVNTPKTQSLGPNYFSLVSLSYPVVVKPKKGSGGEGMKVYNSCSEFSEYINKTLVSDRKDFIVQKIIQPQMSKNYEFRISVSPWLMGVKMPWQTDNHWDRNTGAITILRKRMRQEAVNNGAFGRNIALGNSFFEKIEDESVFNDVITKKELLWAISMSQRAVQCCGLDFGAVDIIFDSESCEWYVIEVNTAPSLTNTDGEVGFTGKRWMQALPEIIKIKNNYECVE